MKNVFKVLGVIALAAIIGFSITACKNDDDNPFIGTWSDGDLTVTCSSSTWNAVYPEIGSWKGTYTNDGDTADFVETNGSIFGTAVVSGNTMTVRSQQQGTFHLTKK